MHLFVLFNSLFVSVLYWTWLDFPFLFHFVTIQFFFLWLLVDERIEAESF